VYRFASFRLNVGAELRNRVGIKIYRLLAADNGLILQIRKCQGIRVVTDSAIEASGNLVGVRNIHGNGPGGSGDRYRNCKQFLSGAPFRSKPA